MAQIISASIDLTKIDKSKIVEGKQGGKYYPISILVNDSQNEHGQDTAIVEAQSKEERERKEKKKYIGNGKTVWRSAAAQSEHSTSGDLPF